MDTPTLADQDLEPEPEPVDTPVKVSVIIPVHNGTRTLRSCLGAIAASDYADYDCIVVDDCSTDDTCEIAGAYSARILSLEGGPYGPGYARNRGAEIAEGDVVGSSTAPVRRWRS